MSAKDVIKLPQPRTSGGVSVEEALQRRRSIRDFPDDPVSIADVSQLLWAAQGVTTAAGERTAPSAGATFPLEVYLVAGRVDDLEAGVYKYRPRTHRLEKVVGGDVRAALTKAALGQDCVKRCAAAFVLASVYGRTTVEYGERGVRYVHMEAGHAGQNIHLQAAALNLGAVVVGAFDDGDVAGLLGLAGKEQPLYIIPVGKLP
jgi:SagB-type dehydrogenase family enzyme